MQVDRYKQLLLKQRDIMIALTARLNERDEQILTLQEELEAYDVHQKCGLAVFCWFDFVMKHWFLGPAVTAPTLPNNSCMPVSEKGWLN